MNCVLYARVSTDKQAEQDLSIPAQLQARRDYASQRDWQVISEYIEPGASAKTAERPELQRLLTCLREAKERVDILLVHKIDRLARNVFDHATIKALLKQRDIRLASVVENIDESVSGQLVENIMASIGQFYSANLSEEVKKGMRQKVLKGGWPHRPPRGYVLITSRESDSKKIEIHPKEGPLMKRAFELYASSWYSVRTLSTRLAREGLVGPLGQPMSQAHLRRLLANSFYAGFVRWHDHENRGTHPALIPRELFDKVQNVIRQRYKNPGPKGSVIGGFPLRGLAICASCRGRMTSERHGKWSYYRCSRQTYRRELCAGRACNADRAHAGIERICRQVQIDRPLAREISIAAKALIGQRLADMAGQQTQLGATRAGLAQAEMQLTQAFTRGDVAPNAYKNEIAQLRAKGEELTKLVSHSVSRDRLEDTVNRCLQLATSFWHLYVPLSEIRQATLLKNLFETIVLDHTGIVGYVLRSPFNELCHAARANQPTDLAAAILRAA
jgi:site-specific DNA recombinase